MAKQLDAFSHTCLMVTPYGVAVELAEKLNRLAPGPTPKKAIFVTTGAEAVENCIKIARAHTGRAGVIAFGGGFHGRTFMAMALTGKVVPYKAGFGPFPAEVYHAPFPIAYHGVSVQESLDALEHIFKYDIEPARVAAIIIEPVMGEGGFYIAPPEFLQALRKLCDQHGIVLVVDEIQTGFARTGKMFAIEHAGVEPDLMTMAKSLAGGFPLAAVVGKANIMDSPAPGGLGGTYAGSPIACAAALAVLEVIEEEHLCQRAEAIGSLMTSTLRAAQKSLPAIGEVRALGAMVAMELVKNGDAHQPDPDLTKALVKRAGEKGPGAALVRPVRQRDPFPRAAHGIGCDRAGGPGARARGAARTDRHRGQEGGELVSAAGKLSGKVAIVTGGGSGIGRAIVDVYAANGARVLAVDLPGRDWQSHFKGNPAVVCLEQDVTAKDAPGNVVNACVQAFGGLDILVNNAGIAIGAQFEETTDEQWDRILGINVTAIFRVSKAAVPHLRARGGGRIINLGSIMSNTAGPSLAAYGTTKHAVAGLSKGMAVDLGKYKITVNYLQPGSIWTALSQPFFDDPNFVKYWEAKAPMGRIGDPEDVAAAALFLATDEAKFVSGAGIAVDGGAAVNF